MPLINEESDLKPRMIYVDGKRVGFALIAVQIELLFYLSMQSNRE